MSDKFQSFVDSFPWVRNSSAPWTPFAPKDLSEATVALVSTGGVYTEGDPPFAIRDSSDVDESFRQIPLGTPSASLRLAHEHYNKAYAEKDINVVFPIERLEELADEGIIAAPARTQFSISGYIPKPDGLYETGREIAKDLKEQGVDAVLLTPV